MLKLTTLINLARRFDYYEESATDFLHNHKIPLNTHSRDAIITLAYNHGWHPCQVHSY
jgi:hypothetical protein